MEFETGTKVICKDPVYFDDERNGFVAKQLDGSRFLVKLETPFNRTNSHTNWLEVDRDYADQVVREA